MKLHLIVVLALEVTFIFKQGSCNNTVSGTTKGPDQTFNQTLPSEPRDLSCTDDYGQCWMRCYNASDEKCCDGDDESTCNNYCNKSQKNCQCPWRKYLDGDEMVAICVRDPDDSGDEEDRKLCAVFCKEHPKYCIFPPLDCAANSSQFTCRDQCMKGECEVNCCDDDDDDHPIESDCCKWCDKNKGECGLNCTANVKYDCKGNCKMGDVEDKCCDGQEEVNCDLFCENPPFDCGLDCNIPYKCHENCQIGDKGKKCCDDDTNQPIQCP